MKFSTTVLFVSAALCATITLAGAQVAPMTGANVPATGAEVPGGQPPPEIMQGDHYLCYEVNQQIKPIIVTLRDQFGTYSAHVFLITRLCNPVQKMYQGRTFPIRNPRLHYVCYRVETKTGMRRVMINNQFGPSTITVKGPTELCLPSIKKLMPQPTPTGGGIQQPMH
jgi:hypothetical protein